MPVVPADPGALPEGLHGIAFELPRSAGSASEPPATGAADAAEHLFRSVLGALAPTTITVDLYAPELREAELFGQLSHSVLGPSDDPLTRHRLRLAPDRAVAIVPVPGVDSLIQEVIRDTGWFSVGAYGVLLDGHRLIDQFLDGIYLRVVSPSPFATTPT